VTTVTVVTMVTVGDGPEQYAVATTGSDRVGADPTMTATMPGHGG
jgi:hypothetical protein